MAKVKKVNIPVTYRGVTIRSPQR